MLGTTYQPSLMSRLAYKPGGHRVRPRIISPVTGEAVPLDDQIGQVIQEGRYKRVGLIGGPGSGKTTALRHLAAVLPPWALAKVRLVDDPQGDTNLVAVEDKESRLIISAGSRLPPTRVARSSFIPSPLGARTMSLSICCRPIGIGAPR